jgi:hypothetical protein
MVLFDPEMGLSITGENVSGGQEGGREINATVKQRKTEFGECYLGIRGGSPHPRG